MGRQRPTPVPVLLRRWLFLLLVAGSSLSLFAQRRASVVEDYIRKYADEAIRQMNDHRVLASVSMAQGILESGAGRSTLASVHNNHFGIKCHKAWQGKRAYRHDDSPDECFRSYESDLDSWRDHSYFLQQPRYKKLFALKTSDYQGWAKGLQQYGYATEKGYANRLIQIIELYELYELDKGRYPGWMSGKPSPLRPASSKEATKLRESFKSYGLVYILAEEGDSFSSIAQDLEISAKRLAKYNDAPVDFPLHAGDVVYLETKNRRTTEDYPDHKVEVGDSMHSIAQRYGITVSSLYKLNKLDPDYFPEEGDILVLR